MARLVWGAMTLAIPSIFSVGTEEVDKRPLMAQAGVATPGAYGNKCSRKGHIGYLIPGTRQTPANLGRIYTASSGNRPGWRPKYPLSSSSRPEQALLNSLNQLPMPGPGHESVTVIDHSYLLSPCSIMENLIGVSLSDNGKGPCSQQATASTCCACGLYNHVLILLMDDFLKNYLLGCCCC